MDVVTLRLLVARDNPLPDLAPSDFTADRGDTTPFATPSA